MQGSVKEPPRAAGMTRRVVIAFLVLMSAGAGSAAAKTLRVCRHGCAYRQVAGAVAAARDGDTVTIARGTYRGGVDVTKSLIVDGAGAGWTTIRGGGPVITVGTRGASSEPTVRIRGLTITGGVTHGSFDTTFQALGGGVFVPPAADGAAPTTLTIVHSAITGNVAAPTSEIDSGLPCGPSGDCGFAHAGGGGIDSWGDLTVRHTLVAGNQASGPFTSDANGGGIYSQDGTLTVDHAVVVSNRALAGIPHGRFAEGAGIMVDNFFSPKGTCVSPQPACRFVLRDSIVNHNLSRLESNLPLFSSDGNFVLLANAGGVHVGDNVPTTVQASTISHNAAISDDRKGEASSIDAGMIVGASSLTMRGTRVNRNLTATTASTVADVAPVGSALEVDGSGTIVGTSIVGNVATTFSPAGEASTTGGLGVFDTDLLTVQDSLMSRNLTLARSDTGSASVLGGAVFNNAQLTLDHVVVSRNIAGAACPPAPPGRRHLERRPRHRAARPHPRELQGDRELAPGRPGHRAPGRRHVHDLPGRRDGHADRPGNRPDQCAGCSLAAPMARPGLAKSEAARANASRTLRRVPVGP